MQKSIVLVNKPPFLNEWEVVGIYKNYENLGRAKDKFLEENQDSIQFIKFEEIVRKTDHSKDIYIKYKEGRLIYAHDLEMFQNAVGFEVNHDLHKYRIDSDDGYDGDMDGPSSNSNPRVEESN